ncbi:hypothetical protein JCM10213_008119 [Rhodosporidiobolus nylandii]
MPAARVGFSDSQNAAKRSATRAHAVGQAEEVGDVRKTEGDDDKEQAAEDAKLLPTPSPASTSSSENRERLSSLPFDILYSICIFLHPGNLLLLAQTSKSIRALLFSPNSKQLWKQARKSVGLPELEAGGMNEMQAQTSPTTKPQICGSEAYTRPDYSVRVRCCLDCLKSNLLTEVQIDELELELHPLSLTCSLTSFHSPASGSRAIKTPHFFLPQVVEVSAHLTELQWANALLELDENEDVVLQQESDAALSAYVAEREQFQAKVHADAEEILECESTIKDEKQLLAKQEKAARRAAYVPFSTSAGTTFLAFSRPQRIERKLSEYGYSDVDTQHLYRNERGAFNSTKPLTEMEWKKCRDKLVAAAQRSKNERLAAERPLKQLARQKQLQPLYAELSRLFTPELQHLFPTFSSWVVLPAVEAIWQPDSAVANPAGWSSLASALNEDAKRVAHGLKVRLFDLLARDLLARGASLDEKIQQIIALEPYPADAQGHLAPLYEYLPNSLMDPVFARGGTSLFSCAVCSAKLPFPLVLSHTQMQHPSPSSTSLSPSIARDPLRLCKLPHRAFGEAASGMLRKAGIKEDQVTHEELEEMGSVFIAVMRSERGELSRIEGKTSAEITAGRSSMLGVTQIALVPEDRVVSLEIAAT